MARLAIRAGPCILRHLRRAATGEDHDGCEESKAQNIRTDGIGAALLGMTQTDLGDALGLTFQQVQQYENGKNRISASRLYDLCRVLDVSINFFFEDTPPEVAAISPGAKKRGKAKKLPKNEPNPMVRRETLNLVRAYYKIENADVRKGVYELTKAIGAAGV